MQAYSQKVEVRWSDLDPNFHLRHSVYYDFAAFSRITFLKEHGITPAVMMQLNIGPVIFREECVFKREIHFGDNISINIYLEKCTQDFSRWTIRHELIKDAATLCAVLTVDGAWIDTLQRKLTLPPASITAAFEAIPKAANFM
ncbi:MAG: hypothetical protein RL172_1454 [Bacteroidota bacterium]|jgi:acyl-CoA thioester hydrolase